MAQLPVFEGDLTHFDPRRPFAGDERIPVQFYTGAVLDAQASDAAGRPIYQDADCIKIYVNKDEILDRPCYPSDKARWARQFAAWKATGANDPGMIGTPLEKVPFISRAQAEELRYFKVFTVEHLAELPDATVQGVPGLQTLKSKAQAIVTLAKEQAPLVRMQEELATRDSTIAALQQRLNELAEQVNRAEAEPQPKRRALA